MISLKETLKNEIICGKHIIEKLKISKNNRNNNYDTVSVDIPVPDTGKLWKTLELPKYKYIIYNDKYRGDLPHIAMVDDFMCQVMLLQDDFEDFNPAEDILFASDDKIEIMKYVFKNILKVDMPKQNEEYFEWEERVDCKNGNRICDGLYFIFYCLMGSVEIDSPVYFKNKEDMEDILNTFNLEYNI